MNVLITGITGSLGTELTKQILETTNWDIVGLSRDEQKQYSFIKHPRIRLILGDIRDKNACGAAVKDVSTIFHLAALKHVDLLEFSPTEAMATNYQGTLNLLNAMNKHQNMVFISTDKAVRPINAYGYSKAIAEKIVLLNPKNAVCRYGNVLGSRGSILPYFASLSKQNKPHPITNDQMTRFWINLTDAAKFVLKCASKSGINIPPIKASSLLDVSRAIHLYYGSTAGHHHVGIRPGEKIHEDIELDLNSKDACQYTDEELTDLIKRALI